MKLFQVSKDGGPCSKVWGFFLIEIKSLFSVALLCFEDGTREAYHSHAFNCVSWVVWGWGLIEHRLPDVHFGHFPSPIPFVTRRDHMHQVKSVGRTWVLTFRGPWEDEWLESTEAEGVVRMTHGRQKIV